MKHSRVSEASPLMGKSFFRIMLAGLILVVIILEGLTYFDSVYQEALVQKHELTVDRFRSGLDFIHRQWSIKGKPSQLNTKFVVQAYANKANETKLINVQLNQQGWPIAINNQSISLDCDSIWLYLGQNNMLETKVSVTDNACIFRLKETSDLWVLYRYQPQSGQIEVVVED